MPNERYRSIKFLSKQGISVPIQAGDHLIVLDLYSFRQFKRAKKKIQATKIYKDNSLGCVGTKYNGFSTEFCGELCQNLDNIMF